MSMDIFFYAKQHPSSGKSRPNLVPTKKKGGRKKSRPSAMPAKGQHGQPSRTPIRPPKQSSHVQPDSSNKSKSNIHRQNDPGHRHHPRMYFPVRLYSAGQTPGTGKFPGFHACHSLYRALCRDDQLAGTHNRVVHCLAVDCPRNAKAWTAALRCSHGHLHPLHRIDAFVGGKAALQLRRRNRKSELEPAHLVQHRLYRPGHSCSLAQKATKKFITI